MEPRDKCDLPEVVAEILIEQHAMREEVTAMRQETLEGNAALRQEIRDSNTALGNTLRDELRSSHEGMVQLFNGMTNAILDAMNRGNERYHSTTEDIDLLKARVNKLEPPGTGAA